MYERMSEDLHPGGMSTVGVRLEALGWRQLIMELQSSLSDFVSSLRSHAVADTGSDEDSERQVAAGSTDDRTGASDHRHRHPVFVFPADGLGGWPGLESDSSKPRGFLRSAQSSPGHPAVPAATRLVRRL